MGEESWSDPIDNSAASIQYKKKNQEERVFHGGGLESQRVQSRESGILRCNNRLLISLRDGEGDSLHRAIGELRVVSAQPQRDFRKKVRELEISSNSNKQGWKEFNRVK